MANSQLAPWQGYIQLYQQLRAASKADKATVQLYALSEQLASVRLALTEQPSALLRQQTALTPALARIEILYHFCLDYQYPSAITRLLLVTSFCSSLDAESASNAANKLTNYPALACAKRNQQSLPSNILTILNHCYAIQRKISYHRQQPLSNLLTLAEQLTAAQKTFDLDNFRQRIAYQLMYSRCELELKLLAVLAKTVTLSLNLTEQPLAASKLLSSDSAVSHLPLDDYARLESYLEQQPVMAGYLMQRASQLNRQRQKISQVKLAISLLGINALPLLLASAELQQQLTDLKLPNHLLLQQFTQCFASALGLLLPAELTKDKATLLAYCLCAPLWLSPNNYLQPIVKVKPPPFQLNLPLATLLAEADYQTNVNILLQRYQLNTWLNSSAEVILYLKQKPSKLSVTSLALLTAWQAATVVLTYAGPATTNLPFLQQLLLRLQKLTAANFSYQAEELCLMIATANASICPLQLNL